MESRIHIHTSMISSKVALLLLYSRATNPTWVSLFSVKSVLVLKLELRTVASWGNVISLRYSILLNKLTKTPPPYDGGGAVR
jgi:hypothetical protein